MKLMFASMARSMMRRESSGEVRFPKFIAPSVSGLTRSPVRPKMRYVMIWRISSRSPPARFEPGRRMRTCSASARAIQPDRGKEGHVVRRVEDHVPDVAVPGHDAVVLVHGHGRHHLRQPLLGLAVEAL